MWDLEARKGHAHPYPSWTNALTCHHPSCWLYFCHHKWERWETGVGMDVDNCQWLVSQWRFRRRWVWQMFQLCLTKPSHHFHYPTKFPLWTELISFYPFPSIAFMKPWDSFWWDLGYAPNTQMLKYFFLFSFSLPICLCTSAKGNPYLLIPWKLMNTDQVMEWELLFFFSSTRAQESRSSPSYFFVVC